MNAISVMLVDDDPFIREVVAAALGAKPGVQVQSYASSSDALAAARVGAPDIMVLDYAMPDIDGFALYRELRQILSRMPPVVFLTANEDPDLIARLRAASAAGMLAKPFDPAKIAEQILALGADHRAGMSRDARLDAVAANFRASLPQTMAEIDKEWSSLRREWQRSIAESLLMRVHKLAGASGLFKLHDFGAAARAVEVAVLAQLDGEGRGAAVSLETIESTVARLWDAAISATS